MWLVTPVMESTVQGDKRFQSWLYALATPIHLKVIPEDRAPGYRVDPHLNSGLAKLFTG